MRLVWVAVLVVFVAAGSYYIYQTPQVRQLLKPASKPQKPLEFLERRPGSRPEKDSTRAKPVPAETNIQPDEEIVPPAAPQSDQELLRLILRILAAKRLSDGVSVSAHQGKIAIHGAVESARKREAILRIAKAVCAGRELDTTGLSVAR